MQETQVQTLGQDDPLEEGVSTHSKLLSSVQLIVTPWKPVLFLPRESRGQRCLAGYGPQGRKESDTTEATQQRQQKRLCNEIFGTRLGEKIEETKTRIQSQIFIGNQTSKSRVIEEEKEPDNR